MVWAKIDDSILDNPKIAAAGVIGFAMHVAGITYCCRNVLTNKRDGFVPDSVARRLLDTTDVLSEYLSYVECPQAVIDGVITAAFDLPTVLGTAVADHLVTCGLWERVEGGYLIHDYDEYNPTRAEAEAERDRRSKAGKEGARKRWGDGVGHSVKHGGGHSGSHGRSDGKTMAKRCPDPDPDPDPDPKGIPQTPLVSDERESGVVEVAPPPADRPPRKVTNATDDGVMGDAVAQWREGIRSVTQQPFALAQGGPTVVVVEAILAHCPDVAKRPSWAKLKGAAWARASKGRVLKPHDFADWLNSGEPDRSGAAKQDSGGVVYDGPAVRAERARRERDWREAEKNAAPAPIADLMAAVGGGGKP